MNRTAFVQLISGAVKRAAVAFVLIGAGLVLALASISSIDTNANTTFNNISNAIANANGDDGGYYEPYIPPMPPVPDTHYASVVESAFLTAQDHPLSTFSVDVDTASYSSVRRHLHNGVNPPKQAVRIEEFVNYFDYDYPQPTGRHPFSVNIETATCPWRSGHQLVRIGLQARRVETDQNQPCNLLFLLDVSGSMFDDDKLPLVKASMRMLVRQLDKNDRIAIVVYAGASGLALPSTPANRRQEILSALDNLEAGGSTNGAAGIELAYKTATRNFIPGGVNRVILCTDGDFNVGASSQSDLLELIEKKARTGVFLNVLGFGSGGVNDATAELLADNGNGVYSYIDTAQEARKVLVKEIGSTLVTIAKDVKIQVDFNPAQVTAYRLIGYDNRRLADDDFKNDAKDAGDIGAGHSVTALYEVVPAGVPFESRHEPSKYQVMLTRPAPATASSELLTVRLRYKQPDGSKSVEFRKTAPTGVVKFSAAPADFRFAAAVTAFGLVLGKSKHAGKASLAWAARTARQSLGKDPHGYRREFVELSEIAAALQ